MKLKILGLILVLSSVFIPVSSQAVSYSSTNRLLVSANNSSPLIYTAVTPSYVAPVYNITLKNYSPKSLVDISVHSIELGYRSSDPQKNELTGIIAKVNSPFYPLEFYIPVKPGDQYFMVDFSPFGPLYIPANETAQVTFYAVVNSNSTYASSGEKFMFYLRDFGVSEMLSDTIVKSNFVGTNSNWITIQ